jgi:hypothetical protein
VRALLDLVVAPRAPDAAPTARRASWRDRPSRGPGTPVALGVLAPARDLSHVAAGAGLAVAARAPAVLVCLHAPDRLPAAPAMRAPATAGAARLASSLRARDLDAHARGRLAVAALPSDPGAAAVAAARAQAAASGLPSVLALAVRHDDLDALLAARDAIVVALRAGSEPGLAPLVVSGAQALGAAAVAFDLRPDPLARALANAGARAPRALRDAVAEALGRSC